MVNLFWVDLGSESVNGHQLTLPGASRVPDKG